MNIIRDLKNTGQKITRLVTQKMTGSGICLDTAKSNVDIKNDMDKTRKELLEKYPGESYFRVTMGEDAYQEMKRKKEKEENIENLEQEIYMKQWVLKISKLKF
jgi:Fe-S oxidoreductase